VSFRPERGVPHVAVGLPTSGGAARVPPEFSGISDAPERRVVDCAIAPADGSGVTQWEAASGEEIRSRKLSQCQRAEGQVNFRPIVACPEGFRTTLVRAVKCRHGMHEDAVIAPNAVAATQLSCAVYVCCIGPEYSTQSRHPDRADCVSPVILVLSSNLAAMSSLQLRIRL
jgi:hypothetical protein